MNKVSIIVPVYKVEQYLLPCVNSLTSQTHSDLEIHLVDDGSPDRCGSLCDELAKKDHRIVVIHQANQGVSAARNHALDVMTGEWVCFCDGDDWYEPDFVEKMLSCAQQEKADYVICDYQIVSDRKMPIKAHTLDGFSSGCDPRQVIALGPLASCTHMVHSKLFVHSHIRYPVGCRQYEELPVIPGLAKYATRIAILDEALYNYFQRGDGSSASNLAKDYRENFLKAHAMLRDILGSGYEAELEYHAIYALHYGEILAMCKQGAGRKEILAQIAKNKSAYPNYLHNPYFRQMGLAKRMFLLAESAHLVFVLRMFAKLHSMLVN